MQSHNQTQLSILSRRELYRQMTWWRVEAWREGHEVQWRLGLVVYWSAWSVVMTEGWRGGELYGQG